MLIYHINPFHARALNPSLGGEPCLKPDPSGHGVERSVSWKPVSRVSNHDAVGIISGTLCRARCWNTLPGPLSMPEATTTI